MSAHTPGRFSFRLIHMNSGWRHFVWDREAGLGGDFINEEGFSSLSEAKKAAKRRESRGSLFGCKHADCYPRMCRRPEVA